MKCPKCNGKTKTVEGRINASNNEVYRRRVCLNCKHTFYTVEFPITLTDRFWEEWDATIIKKKQTN